MHGTKVSASCPSGTRRRHSWLRCARCRILRSSHRRHGIIEELSIGGHGVQDGLAVCHRACLVEGCGARADQTSERGRDDEACPPQPHIRIVVRCRSEAATRLPTYHDTIWSDRHTMRRRRGLRDDSASTGRRWRRPNFHSAPHLDMRPMQRRATHSDMQRQWSKRMDQTHAHQPPQPCSRYLLRPSCSCKDERLRI
jgi:hypothetical protein